MNRGPFWPRVLRGLIGAPNPLPGKLCDETPDVSEHLSAPKAGRWQPRIPVHEVDVIGAEEIPGGEIDRELLASLRREVLMLRGNLRLARADASAAEHELCEVTADRDRLDAANGVLVAKVRSLGTEKAVLEIHLKRAQADVKVYEEFAEKDAADSAAFIASLSDDETAGA